MLGMTTIKILRARVQYLMHENGVLRRENARLRETLEITGNPVPERDYSLGGHEWIDPVSGIDTWSGAD